MKAHRQTKGESVQRAIELAITEQELIWHKPGRGKHRGVCAEVMVEIEGRKQRIRVWSDTGECKTLDGLLLATVDLSVILPIQTGF